MPHSPVLRSPLDTWLYAMVSIICGGTAVLGTSAVLLSTNPGAGAGQLVLGFAGLGAIAVLFLRLALVRVVLHDDHVQLVNPMRTVRIPWTDIEDVDLVSRNGWVVRVWTNGQPRRAWGLCKIGRFGFAAASRHDDPKRDAPRWLQEGYDTLRRRWRSQSRRRQRP